MHIIDTRSKAPRKRHLPLRVRKEVAAALDAVADPMTRRTMVRSFAEQLGVGESTVYSWLQKARTGSLSTPRDMPVSSEELDEILTVFYSRKGVARSAWRECVDLGLWSKSERSFYRFLYDEVDRMIRLAASRDELAARLLGRYVTYTVSHRDYEWQIDLVDLCVQVDLGRQPYAHAWAVVVVDKRTGVVRGWALTAGQPTAGAVVNALVMGIRARDETLQHTDGTSTVVRLEGAPVMLRCDNGQQLLADLVVGLMAEAGTIVMPTQEHDPTAKGLIERYNLDVKRFSVDVFGTTRGPKTLRGKELFRDDSLVVTPDELTGLFGELVHTHDRTAKRGEKKSPLELYAEDSYVAPPVDETVLARFHLEQQPRLFTVERGQIRFRNIRWTAQELEELRGRRVEVWTSSIDPDYVEVRAEGRRFQVAPSASQTPEQVEELLESRGAKVAEVNRHRAAGAQHNKNRTAEAIGLAGPRTPCGTDGQHDEGDLSGPDEVDRPDDDRPVVSTGADVLADLDAAMRSKENYR
jgi:hypothetical protein